MSMETANTLNDVLTRLMAVPLPSLASLHDHRLSQAFEACSASPKSLLQAEILRDAGGTTMDAMFEDMVALTRDLREANAILQMMDDVLSQQDQILEPIDMHNHFVSAAPRGRTVTPETMHEFTSLSFWEQNFGPLNIMQAVHAIQRARKLGDPVAAFSIRAQVQAERAEHVADVITPINALMRSHIAVRDLYEYMMETAEYDEPATLSRVHAACVRESLRDPAFSKAMSSLLPERLQSSYLQAIERVRGVRPSSLSA